MFEFQVRERVSKDTSSLNVTKSHRSCFYEHTLCGPQRKICKVWVKVFEQPGRRH